MAGVAFAVDGDGVGFATESYAASALYTTLASLSGALSRIRRAKDRHKKARYAGGCLDRVELLRQRRLKYTMPLFSSRSLLEQFLFA
jgi:hypothetical protein